ncbi:hypothetical protein G6O67_007659 [Ophiocordyceps sinensis]|uniref:Tetraspanin Tsp3 n=1 Tax=Ophiocordyceps sinensis TaxID=72228 RepID=A0A8H4LVS0_9HYPO|nr:hypothetical protein G6O67_007659 [Ophiocordyceps sinensis]
MAKWLAVYPLLVLLLLLGVAIYEHINSTALSLPFSRALTIATVLLPLLAAINAICYTRLDRLTSFRRALAIALQALQAVLGIVLATLFFSHVVPSAGRECLLTTTWQRLFSAHDAASIRRIQDAFNCCGFNTVQDRPWPFPHQQSPSECAVTHGRNTACAEPWQMALQRNSGLEFGVVLAVGLFQLASLLMAGAFSSSSAIPTRRVLQHRASNDTERDRLLQGARGAGHPGHEAGQGGQSNETSAQGRAWETESPRSNPWGSGRV